MKIEHTNVDGAGANRLGHAQAASRPGGYSRTGEAANPEAGLPGDHLDLSGLGRALRASLSESPERSAYIDRLAELYKSGSYRPDAAESARRIVEDALKP
jgi:hypothetical protein